jgi:dipeptidyl aminopeptidase/acylaminoacyl peptidase
LADEVFVGLRRLGQKVVYAKYGREGHVPARWGYANQLDYCRRMIAWFDEHLPPQEAASD